jgi:serine/threonine-protein kinase
MTCDPARRLRLIDPIGSGAMGTVWRAWDRRSGDFVAAKILHHHSLVTGRAPDLRHPHLAVGAATDITATTADSWSVLPLVRGGSVERLLAEHGALPTGYVAVLLDQLLAALSVVHDAGTVHRDVKPANLLLEPTGSGRPHLRLAVFGVATPIGAPAPPAGTDGYLPPEAEAGAPPEPRHDLYAAGMTAVELLTGRVPRTRRDIPRTPLRALLLRLTDPDPARRPPTAGAARAALRAIGVPAGAPWSREPHPPVVPDRLRRLTLSERLLFGWLALGCRLGLGTDPPAGPG